MQDAGNEMIEAFEAGAAQAFHAEVWLQDNEDTVPAGGEILDYLPDTPDWAKRTAAQFRKDIESRMGKSLVQILDEWEKAAENYSYLDREPTPENFGFYAAMSAMGHGVGLHDMGVDDDVPSVEPYAS